MKTSHPPILLLILFLAASLQAQPAQVEYTQALRLMDVREYESALPILLRLHRQDPSNYPVFDRAITCLVELKRYPEAITMLERRLDRRYRDIVVAVRLGEVHHIAADTAKAREVWMKTVESNPQDLNAYRYVAETMANRREYRSSISLYLQARQRFNAPDLFVMEIATNHVNAGQSSEGVREFIRFAENNPQNAQVILRQILRFGDSDLNDLAILEIEDRGLTARPHHELMIGLLMEQGYFRRAYQSARQYESVAADGQYPLFQIASRLRAQNQFELAAQAYGYYVGSPRHPFRADAMIEQARTRVTEADVLEFENLDSDGRVDRIIDEADSLLSLFSSEFGSHPRQTEAWLLHAELQLDFLKKTDATQQYADKLSRTPSNIDHLSAYEYLQGRLHLLSGEFAQARVSFTRSNRAVRTGERAELTRYFLALTDFYAGDFEFARLQMRALERMSTSIYANDAIQLRRWLTEGTAGDTTGVAMRGFADGLYQVARGDTSAAWQRFDEGLRDDASGLRPEILTQAVKLYRRSDPQKALELLDTWLVRFPANPNKEQHLWLKARILDAQDRHAEAMSVYIETLESFPVGFYSDRIRARLIDLNSIAL